MGISVETNKEAQIKNSLVYMLPILVSNALPFITVPIFSRILAPEDFGVLALAGAYAIFVSGLANFGMTVAYGRNYFEHRRNDQRTGQLFYSVLLFVIVNFILLEGLTYVFRGSLSNLIFGSGEHGYVLVVMVGSMGFASAIGFHLTYFRNVEQAGSFVAYTLASSLTNLAISLFLVVYLRIGLMGIVYAQFLSGAIVFGFVSYRFTRLLPFSLSLRLFIDSLKIAYPITPKILFDAVSTQIDKYMVGLLDSVGGAGVYSIGGRISYLVFDGMTAIQNVFAPQVYTRMFDMTEKEGGEAIGRYLTPFVYVSVSLGLLISLFSEEVISLLLPPAYHGAIAIAIILSMYYGVLFFGKLTGTQLAFAKKTHVVSLMAPVRMIIGALLTVAFVIQWGAIGAASAMLLTGLISGAISFTIEQRYYEISWEYKRVGAIFAVFFGASVLMVFLRSADVGYAIRLAAKVMSLSLFVYIGMRIRFITHSNLKLLKALIRKSVGPSALRRA